MGLFFGALSITALKGVGETKQYTSLAWPSSKRKKQIPYPYKRLYIYRHTMNNTRYYKLFFWLIVSLFVFKNKPERFPLCEGRS